MGKGRGTSVNPKGGDRRTGKEGEGELEDRKEKMSLEITKLTEISLFDPDFSA